MKYVRTKSDKIKTTPNSGHHKNIGTKKTVVSAGRFTEKGKVQTYSRSYGLNKKPEKGDAKKIAKRFNRHA